MKQDSWSETAMTNDAQGSRLATVTPISRVDPQREIARLTEENARLRRQQANQANLWQIAHSDPLTQLWNRRYADARLAEELSRTKRDGGYRFSLILADVDDLKWINDQSGHCAGDAALVWIALFLKQGLRTHDVCCRIGGDEFLLILPGSTQKDCLNLVERLRRRWRVARADDPRAVSASLGTASFPTQGLTVDTLLRAADESMYANKRGRDRGRSSIEVDRVQVTPI